MIRTPTKRGPKTICDPITRGGTGIRQAAVLSSGWPAAPAWAGQCLCGLVHGGQTGFDVTLH